MIDVMEIRNVLPHRFPFLMVDRILELDPGRRIVGLKNVTVNEGFFQGHFPEQPVMPGVLQIEALAQVAGVLAFKSGADGDTVYFMSMDKVKFRRPVVPGDQLILTVELLQSRGKVWKVRAEASVDGQKTAEGELTAMIARRGG